MSEQMTKPITSLQGQKLLIWEELEFPRALKTLYKVLPDIPQASIRRELQELKSAGLVEQTSKKVRVRKYGWKMAKKWRRVEEDA
jgi:DNA-binding HxlR family transcriptional regulator